MGSCGTSAGPGDAYAAGAHEHQLHGDRESVSKFVSNLSLLLVIAILVVYIVLGVCTKATFIP